MQRTCLNEPARKIICGAVIGILSLILLAVLAWHIFASYAVAAFFERTPQVLLVWESPPLKIVVKEDPKGLIAWNPTLIIHENGVIKTQTVIEDDLHMEDVALIRYGDWYLVAERAVIGEKIWGGYNASTREIFGEHLWEHLPIQEYDGLGKVLATEKLD